MAITGRSIRSLVTRAARRYHHSGLWLPGTKGKRAAAAGADSATMVPDDHDDVVQTAPTEIGDNLAPSAETRSTDTGAYELSDSPSLASIELPGETDANPVDETIEDDQESAEANTVPSLADILANPLPPALSVDNLISESLGNIFQKNVAKDPVMRSLLDLHGEVDMRDLAAELKEFAIEIGASKEVE